MMNKTVFIAAFTAFIISSSSIYAQKSLLQSGPMTGYSEMREVLLWLQTKEEAKVYIEYYNVKTPEIKHKTEIITTQKEKAYTAHLLADELEPGEIYYYTLYINNKKITFNYQPKFQTQELWKWRKDPPEFCFATGSCAYINEEKYDRPGKGYGGEYGIFESIADKTPDFMIWLGDNTYLREADWNSRTGILRRYTHTRSTNEMQRLLATTHNYAVWDDHDYGPNDSDKSYWGKKITLEAFQLFWANPSYGIGDIKGAITYFNWADCDFFLLDNRYHRDPNDLKKGTKTILGKEQLEWLKNSLVYSKADFKFIVLGGQFLTTSGIFETYSNYGFSDERNEIIEFIHYQEIKNVIFLTGDRHHSEISILKRTDKPVIYDITTSPLTSGVAPKREDENNQLGVQGSFINKRNFSLFTVSGKSDERKVVISYHDSEGKKLFEYIINKEKK